MQMQHVIQIKNRIMINPGVSLKIITDTKKIVVES